MLFKINNEIKIDCFLGLVGVLNATEHYIKSFLLLHFVDYRLLWVGYERQKSFVAPVLQIRKSKLTESK